MNDSPELDWALSHGDRAIAITDKAQIERGYIYCTNYLMRRAGKQRWRNGLSPPRDLGWQAKAPAPQERKPLRTKVGQTLSSVNPAISAIFSQLLRERRAGICSRASDFFSNRLIVARSSGLQ